MNKIQFTIACLLLLISFRFPFQLENNAITASSSDLSDFSLLAMPEEYVNYTIVLINGTLWAKIDGKYPIYFINTPMDNLQMFYPTPPGTKNIRLELDQKEISWSNYTDTNPSALHHTAIGEWPMIHSMIKPSSDQFLLSNHYEHPIFSENGMFLFLYDLNISPYLSQFNPSSTAYFTLRFEIGISDFQAYTTKSDIIWDPKDYKIEEKGNVTLVSIQIFSEYSKPLPGDLIIRFSDSPKQNINKLFYWIILALTITVVFAAILMYKIVKHRNANSKQRIALSLEQAKRMKPTPTVERLFT